MKTKLLITIGIITIGIISVFVVNNGHDLFHYMNLPYEWHDSFGFTDTNVVKSTQCASEELAWLEPCIDVKMESDSTPEQLEEIDGYAIDYDGEVKHLPFADVCTNEMKMILLTHSNIALPDEEFMIDDVELPFGMNQEDFERCSLETSFTKSRWNMVTMENPEPEPEPEPTYTLTEVHCFPNQVIYNDECIYVLTPSDEFPKDMTKYFSMVDGKIINFCEIKNLTLQDRENPSGVTLDRCFEISHYKISDVNVIKFQSTTPPTWINIRIENLTRNVELGSSPTFRVVESGWGNGCTSPTLEVYHMIQEIGNNYTFDNRIYKHHIVYSCPYYEPTYPPRDVLRIWDESDFTNFPICEEQGRYLIVGDSGYERLPLDYYYCGVENEN